MVFDIIIKPIVFLDVEEAVIYYEGKSKGLGKRFLDNFLFCVQEIKNKPHHYSYIRNPVRRHIIKKFPYKIYYIISKDKVIVLGVSHAKRSNTYIKARLRLLK
jgi:hypothetical protein